MRGTTKQRFLSKAALPNDNGCMLWLAGGSGDGYGRFKVAGRTVQAHRFAYEMWVEPIPEDLQIDHLCRVRRCVAPAHLEPVTQRENILRGVGFTAEQARKTHCNNGHSLTGENLLPSQLRRGRRICRTCHLAYMRERKRQRRAELKAA